MLLVFVLLTCDFVVYRRLFMPFTCIKCSILRFFFLAFLFELALMFLLVVKHLFCSIIDLRVLLSAFSVKTLCKIVLSASIYHTWWMSHEFRHFACRFNRI